MTPFWMWTLGVLILVPIVALVAYALFDLLTRSDMSGIKKTIWILAVVLMPIVGPVLYIVFRPTRRGEIDPLGREPSPSARAQELLDRADPNDGIT